MQRSAGAAQDDQKATAGSANLDDQALSRLKDHQAQSALKILEQQIAAHPEDATAKLLAASAAIELGQADQAVSYGEQARKLEPDNWKIHTTLVTAYAMAGRVTDRDRERATLRDLHAEARIPDARQTSGFLLDVFSVSKYRVDAVEYFAPVGNFHIYYRFVIRDAEGRRVWQIDVQSDDFNQASWAKAHPEEAAKGTRQFQITGSGGGTRADYRSFSGTQTYDWIKAQVVEIVTAQAGHFPTERVVEPD